MQNSFTMVIGILKREFKLTKNCRYKKETKSMDLLNLNYTKVILLLYLDKLKVMLIQ